VGDYESFDWLPRLGKMGMDVPHVACCLSDDPVRWSSSLELNHNECAGRSVDAQEVETADGCYVLVPGLAILADPYFQRSFPADGLPVADEELLMMSLEDKFGSFARAPPLACTYLLVDFFLIVGVCASVGTDVPSFGSAYGSASADTFLSACTVGRPTRAVLVWLDGPVSAACATGRRAARPGGSRRSV
jgi:hypothetical protein